MIDLKRPADGTIVIRALAKRSQDDFSMPSGGSDCLEDRAALPGRGKKGQAPRGTIFSIPRGTVGSEPVPFCHGLIPA